MTDTEPPPVPQPPAPLSELFGFLPEQAANPIGVAAKSAWIACVEASPTGSFGGQGDPGMLIQPQGTFSQLFFAAPTTSPYTAEVTAELGADWWAAFSTAVLCEALYNIATDTQTAINQTEMETDLASMRASLSTSGTPWYQTVFASEEASLISAAVQGNAPAALNTYLGVLTSPQWITAKQAALSDGEWPDPEWELFHHAIKLLVLGATQDQVTGAFTQLASGGLTLPEDMNASTWTHYLAWLPEQTVNWNDFQSDGSTGMTQDSTIYYITGGTKISVPQGVASAYLETTKYQIPPPASCFAPGTRVLLPDGSDIAIEDIKPSDTVWTPTGPGTVAVAARAARHGRPLYRLTRGGFAFSDTHPFATTGSGPAVAAVHPARAERFMPGLADTGIGRVSSDTPLRWVDRSGVPVDAPVRAVEQIDDETGLDLYDLILTPGADGLASYAVGDGGDAPWLVVAPEAIRIERRPQATLVGIAMLAGIGDVVDDRLAHLSRPHVPTVLQTAFDIQAGDLLPAAIRSLQNADADTTATLPHTVFDAVGALLPVFVAENGDSNWLLGGIYEGLTARHLDEIETAITLGWRLFTAAIDDCSVVAITLADVRLHNTANDDDWSLSVAYLETSDELVLPPLPGSPYRRPVGAVLYRPSGCDGPALTSTMLETTLSIGTHSMSGQRRITGDLPSGYRRHRIALHDEHHRLAATVAIDLRLLTPDEAAAENLRRTRWTDDDAAAFVASLGPQLADVWAGGLGDALATSRALHASSAPRGASVFRWNEH